MPRPNTISVVIPSHPSRSRAETLTGQAAGRPRGSLLQQALESVHGQTLPADAICLAIDTDGDGAAPTRDRALRMANTQWVAMLDSDDVFMPRHLQLLLNHALDTGADFVYSWFKIWQQYPSRGIDHVLEDDPIFPLTHYTADWDPENPIETTITTLVRTELAREVGFVALDRGEANSGEDFRFTLGCQAAGGKISHLKRKTWLWRHHEFNTSGLPVKGDGPLAGVTR